MHTFSTPEPVNLKVELWVGEVDVTARDTDTTTVELTSMHGDDAQDLIDAARVEQRGRDIVVELPKLKSGLFRRNAGVHARIVVPTDSAAKIETASADVTTHGQLGDTQVSSGSGDVEIDRTHDVDVKTGSGDITVDEVLGSCAIKCGSAEVAVGPVAGNANIMSGSGDIVVESVGGSVKVKSGSGDVILKQGGEEVEMMTGSGDVLVKRLDHGRLKAKTGSGDIAVGVARGTAAYLDIMSVTGDVRSELDGAEAPDESDRRLEIHVQTGSGDVVLQRA